MTVNGHWTGNAKLEFYLLDPPLNTEPITGTNGLASLAGMLDANITTIPNVIGAQRYVDGSSISDFVASLPFTDFSNEKWYDPSFW